MGMNSVEQEILNEKEKLAKSIVLVASELSRINSPEIRVWDGYCPESTSDEIAHFHYDSPNGIICISRYRLRSMSFDEIENTMIHEVTHFFIDNHGLEFQLVESKIKQAIAEHRFSHKSERRQSRIAEKDRAISSKLRKSKHPSRFYIITTDFNVTMNDFIANYGKRTIVDRYWTGGLKDIFSSKYHPFKKYSDELEEFRENLFKKSLKKDLINLEDVKQEFLYLVDFYKSAQIDNTKLWTDELEPVLLKPLRGFFMRVDNLFSTDYLRKKIVQIFIAKSEEVSFSKRIRASISKKYRQKLEAELMDHLFCPS